MKKNEWIDYVKLHVSKFDQQRVFHRKMIEMAINVSYENLAYNTYQNVPYVLDTMCVTEEPTIQFDSVVDKHYVELDFEPIQLDRIGSGVVSIISPLGDYYFSPAHMNQVKHILRSEVNDFSDDIMFSVIGSKIYFYNLPAELKDTAIRVEVIKPFIEFGGDDVVPIPAGQTKVLLDMVLQTLQMVTPEQSINNNTDTRYGNARSDKSEERSA